MSRATIRLDGANFYHASESVVRPDDDVGGRDARDMLRYDLAFVNKTDPRLVMVVLLKLSGQGTYRGRATHDRWRSFGIKLSAVSTTETIQQIVKNALDWTTYRHPLTADGARDYSRLVPVTLATVLAAHDLHEF